MKKAFLLIISFCLFLSGCKGYNKYPDVTAVTSGLSFIAKLSYMEDCYDYSVVIKENGETELKHISNEKAGIDYTFKKDTVTYNFDGLEYKTDISAIPDSSTADFIYTVFKETGEMRNNVSYKNQEYYIKGETDKYKFKIILGQTGLPIKITDSKMGISVIIKNPTLL
ncbi:MAG: hypothetical protein J6D52_01235 [Clostridia bacterium]|nr:hypothetical protein [Clostridia bacterium]